MKKHFIIMVISFSGTAFSQVGINTTTPKVTLEVVGKPNDNTVADGIIAPRITGNELFLKNNLYGSTQQGTLIYVTAPATGTNLSGGTIDITEVGYYYHNGIKWVKITGQNYTGSASITLSSVNTFERAALTGDVTAAANSNQTTVSNNAITSAKILDGTVATVDLADQAVTAFKLADNSVNTTKIIDGEITTADLANNAVTAIKIADNAITSAKIADSTIATADLADQAVTAFKLADNSVNTTKIVDGTISTVDLADQAVTAFKLADNSVNTTKIVDGTISTVDLANNAVTTVKLADQAVTIAKLPAGATGTTFLRGDGTWKEGLGTVTTDAVRFIGGSIYVKMRQSTGGTLTAAKVINGANNSAYSVGGIQQNSTAGGVNSIIGNGYKISNPEDGIFDIMFDSPLKVIFGISVNILDAYGYNNGNVGGASTGMNPNPNQPGARLKSNDSIQVSFLSKSIIRVKTGDYQGDKENRSFTFVLMGQ